MAGGSGAGASQPSGIVACPSIDGSGPGPIGGLPPETQFWPLRRLGDPFRHQIVSIRFNEAFSWSKNFSPEELVPDGPERAHHGVA